LQSDCSYRLELVDLNAMYLTCAQCVCIWKEIVIDWLCNKHKYWLGTRHDWLGLCPTIPSLVYATACAWLYVATYVSTYIHTEICTYMRTCSCIITLIPDLKKLVTISSMYNIKSINYLLYNRKMNTFFKKKPS